VFKRATCAIVIELQSSRELDLEQIILWVEGFCHGSVVALTVASVIAPEHIRECNCPRTGTHVSSL
jgi:hypothetical protein